MAVTEQEMLRLMADHGAHVVGLCTLLLKDAHLAQDVAQETFIRAWKQPELRRDTERAWLTRVAVNLCRTSSVPAGSAMWTAASPRRSCPSRRTRPMWTVTSLTASIACPPGSAR